MNDTDLIKQVVKQMIRDGEIEITLNVPEYRFDWDHSIENASDVKSVLEDCNVEFIVGK